MVAADRRNSDARRARSAHKTEAQQAFREIIEDIYQRCRAKVKSERSSPISPQSGSASYIMPAAEEAPTPLG
jgi:hypothetical protein